MKHRILITTQDDELYSKIEKCLLGASFELSRARTYQEAVDQITRFHNIMIMADIRLFGENYTMVIKRLRHLAQIPILVLSTCATKAEEIQLLNAGADQYLPVGESFDAERFLAYTVAVIRRYSTPNSYAYTSVKVAGNELKINLNLCKAFINGENLNLTPKQFALLRTLAEHMGEVVTKEELYQAAWENDYDINSDDTLKYHINQIRRKLESYGLPGIIETAWGVGYQFRFYHSDEQ